MVDQNFKELYFIVNKLLNFPYFQLVRLKNNIVSINNNKYIHLGSGDDYIKGLINIDGNIFRKKDLWLDLNNGLPFKSNSVYLVYCAHTLEHFYPNDAIKLLKEMYRVLSDKGIIRLAVPDFDYAMKIRSGKAISSWPRKFTDSTSQAINYIFCDGQHKYAYNFDILSEFCSEAGFTNLYNYSKDNGCKTKDYFGISIGNEPEGSLILELRK